MAAKIGQNISLIAFIKFSYCNLFIFRQCSVITRFEEEYNQKFPKISKGSFTLVKIKDKIIYCFRHHKNKCKSFQTSLHQYEDNAVPYNTKHTE